jgi:hypothetical protein
VAAGYPQQCHRRKEREEEALCLLRCFGFGKKWRAALAAVKCGPPYSLSSRVPRREKMRFSGNYTRECTQQVLCAQGLYIFPAKLCRSPPHDAEKKGRERGKLENWATADG